MLQARPGIDRAELRGRYLDDFAVLDLNAVNLRGNLVSDTPTYGGWCCDGNDVVLDEGAAGLHRPRDCLGATPLSGFTLDLAEAHAARACVGLPTETSFP